MKMPALPFAAMKFSIITPSFNQGRFLPDCVESVLSQLSGTKERRNPSADVHEGTMGRAQHVSLAEHGRGDSAIAPPCIEVEQIVVDAGSTDNTLEVLKRHPHLKWTSEPDKGMSDGINKGFLKATGDWVMWLNCDDYLLPGALAKVAEFIKAKPDADVVHGDCVYVKEYRTPIRRKYDTPVDDWDFLFVGCCIPSTAVFYRRRIIESGHLLDVSYHNCMDWEYYLRLCREGFRFSYLAEALAGFRWHDQSTTRQHWQRMISEGLRCQRAHIERQGLPQFLKNQNMLAVLRRMFQVRRIARRLVIHKRIV